LRDTVHLLVRAKGGEKALLSNIQSEEGEKPSKMKEKTRKSKGSRGPIAEGGLRLGGRKMKTKRGGARKKLVLRSFAREDEGGNLLDREGGNTFHEGGGGRLKSCPV